jgi:hypothetical protein
LIQILSPKSPKFLSSKENSPKQWYFGLTPPWELPPICSPHGLRKAAAVRHALDGATAPELMARFGWKTIGEAQRYIEEANRIRLAESAGEKMRTGIGSPANPVSQKAAQAIENTGVRK